MSADLSTALPKAFRGRSLTIIKTLITILLCGVIVIQGDWNKAFKDELEMFPNGTYKDQVDAAAAGYNILTGKKQVRVIR